MDDVCTIKIYGHDSDLVFYAKTKKKKKKIFLPVGDVFCWKFYSNLPNLVNT